MTHQELHEAALLLAAKGVYQEKEMRKVSKEIQLLRVKSQDTKTKQMLQEVYAWSDKEASLAQAVVHMCKEYLFPRFNASGMSMIGNKEASLVQAVVQIV